MPSVRVRENEGFEPAMRRFKRAVEKAGLLNRARRCRFYEKPSKVRKRKKLAAVKRQLKRQFKENSFVKRRESRAKAGVFNEG